MKKLFSLALVVSTAALVNSVFAFAKYVDITTTYAGGDVTDFPVLVKITTTTPTGFYSDVKNAGADLKFTDASGAGDYPYEIDTWNASGDSYIWVKLPKLSAGMTFRMYYGDEEQTAQTTKPTDVWTGYDLVCHVSGNANDSTANAHEGKLNPDGSSAAGKIGAAHGMSVDNKGAALVHKLYSDGTTGELPDGQFSYSFWVCPNSSLVAWGSIAGPKSANNSDAWGLNVASADGKSLKVHTGKDGSHAYTFDVPGGLPVGEWHKIDVAMDGMALVTYIDGVSAASSTVGSSARRNWPQWTGWGGTTGSSGFGTTQSEPVDVDECRIYSTVADAARVAADYQTVANVATFLSFSEPRGEVTVNVLPQGVIVK